MKITQPPTPMSRREKTESRSHHYRLKSRRLASFHYAPAVLHNKMQQLTTLGFLFTNYSDEVECFRCHIKINDWADEDTPTDIHPRNKSAVQPSITNCFAICHHSYHCHNHQTNTFKQLTDSTTTCYFHTSM